MNKIKNQKNNIENLRSLPLVEEFYSIQGEGYHVGKPAYFIRVGGCDIGCSWCDTKISWNPEIHQLVSIEKITKNANNYPAKSIVVTGGEPTCHNLEPLTTLLKNKGIKTFLETSGTYKITGNWDWICLSPKHDKELDTSTLQLSDELKIIIYDKKDFNWAEKIATKVRKNCKLYLQSEWSRFQEYNPKIIDYIKKHPHWNISIQMHKFLNIP